MTLSILRLGHRIFRDQRISTHVFLTGRALGATKGFYTGQRDHKLEESIRAAAKNWGGSLTTKHIENHKTFLEKYKGKVVHLTAYGVPFQKKLREVKKKRNLLIIVGGEKVPPDVYQNADWNLSVGSQPHSEVASVGIFLYELQSREFKTWFLNAKMKIIPQERGKKLKKIH